MQHDSMPTVRQRRIAIMIAVAAGLLALAFRWYYVMHAQVLQPLDQPNVRADAVDYYRYAWNMVHHAIFSNDLPGSTDVRPNSFRDPGYPLLLAAWMSVTSGYDAWYAAILLTQAVLGGLTVAFLVLALRHQVSNVWLAAGALLMAVWPHSVAMTSFVLSENLFSFLCAAALLCLRSSLSRPASWSLATTGLVLGLAGLTNAVLLPFGAILAIALRLRHLVTTRGAVALALVSLLLPTLWGIRSLTIPDADTSTRRATMNLVQGSWPTYDAAYQLAMKGDEDGVRTMAAIDSEIAAFDHGMATGAKTMLSRLGHSPLTYVGWYAQKPWLLWSWDIRIGQGDIYVYPTRASPFRTQPAWRGIEAFCFLINPLVALLAAIGIVAALFKRHGSRVTTGMAGIVLFVTFVYAVLQSEPRYSVALRGIEIALACLGASGIVRYIRDHATARDADHI